MDPYSYLAVVVATSSTGALSPGPLFFANLALGARKGWREGLKVAIGHMLVEAPLVTLIALGAHGLSDALRGPAEASLNISGGLAIAVFGLMELRDSVNCSSRPEASTSRVRGGLATGILFSLLNPLFITWWISYGVTVVRYGVELFGLWFLPLIYLSHVWLDFVWLTLTAYMANQGASLISSSGYRLVLLASGLALIILGGLYIADGILRAYPYFA